MTASRTPSRAALRALADTGYENWFVVEARRADPMTYSRLRLATLNAVAVEQGLRD